MIRGRATLVRGTLAILAGSLALIALPGVARAQAPTVSIGNAKVREPLWGSRRIVFSITLDESSIQPVTVHYATADGSATSPTDYKAKQGTATFPPGQTRRRVGVLVLADTTADGTETFSVGLSDAVGATIADGTGKGTIMDPTQRTVAVAGAPLSEVAIDPAGRFAYATNPTLNEVEVLNIAKGTLGKPIFVGSDPQGIAITPDGSTLYVADSGGHDVSVVDVASRKELRRITIPTGFTNDRPFSIAIADNGKALLTTTFDGSGYGGELFQIDLATDAVTKRSDIGSVTEDTRLASSFDHSMIGMIVGDDSGGGYLEYSAATDSFGSGGLDEFIDYVSLNGDGSTMLIGPGTYVIDHLVQAGTIAGGGGAVALPPSGPLGYRLRGSNIDVLDVDRFLSVRTVPLTDGVSGRGELAVTPDGANLIALTAHGFTIQSL